MTVKSRNILLVSKVDVLSKIVLGRVAIGFFEQGYWVDGSIANSLLSLPSIVGHLVLWLMLILGVVAIADGFAQFNKRASKFTDKNRSTLIWIYPTISIGLIIMGWAYRSLHGNLPFGVVSFVTSFVLLYMCSPFYDACVTNSRQAALLRKECAGSHD